MGIFGIKFNSKKKMELLSKEAEYWRREYKRELMRNNAWSEAVLNAAMLGKINHEAQRVIYELRDAEMRGIDKHLT